MGPPPAAGKIPVQCLGRGDMQAKRLTRDDVVGVTVWPTMTRERLCAPPGQARAASRCRPVNGAALIMR